MLMQHIAPMPVTRIPPALMPVEECAWCWPLVHPDKPYPEAWSSTVCSEHSAWIIEQARARRLARQADGGVQIGYYDAQQDRIVYAPCSPTMPDCERPGGMIR